MVTVEKVDGKRLTDNQQPTVVLIGGAYGSGKSTVAGLVSSYLENLPDHPLNRKKLSVVDYDVLIGNSSGKNIDPHAMDEVRKRTWESGFIDEISEKINDGSMLVLAPGTFSTRERRERYIQGLSTKATVIGLYFMLPMRQTINDIRSSRRDETHLVNYRRVLGFYRKHNVAFRDEDHTDLLLPEDRSKLPPEYRAMLNAKEHNRNLFTTPDEDRKDPDRQWIVLTHRLQPEHLLSALTNLQSNPVVIREHLYRLHEQNQ